MGLQSDTWNNCLEHAALSDVGLRRANNQDSMTIVVAGTQESWQRRGHLFVVADGMGAHAAGELASKLATDTVAMSYSKQIGVLPAEAIVEAVRAANAQIHSRGQASEDFKGMGTTIDALLLLPQGVLVAHVGDSRTYRWRNDRIEQLTFDHSLVWEMRAAEQIPEGEVPDYIPKNVITRSLGPSPEVQVDLEGPFPVEIGDTFLLCSDGLSGQVKDEEMGVILDCLAPADAVRTLVDLANLRGGPDNITVIVAKVTGPQIAQDDGAGSSADSEPQPVHPVMWVILGVCILATLSFFALQLLLPGWISLGATAIAAVVAYASRFGGDNSTAFDGRRFGRGPYTAAECPPNAEMAESLAGVFQELRDAATNRNWRIDWDRFNRFGSDAEAAKRGGDFRAAIREYCGAISFIMGQLRHQRRGPDDDHQSVLDGS
jgi:protein phosphatase